MRYPINARLRHSQGRIRAAIIAMIGLCIIHIGADLGARTAATIEQAAAKSCGAC